MVLTGRGTSQVPLLPQWLTADCQLQLVREDRMDGISRYIEDLQESLAHMPLDDIRAVIAVLHYARLDGRQVFIMGNGGSAATASHFANDLSKGAAVPDLPLFRAIALTDNMPLFSAYASDLGYQHVFAKQLSNHVQKGDVVIGISISGFASNMLRALEMARSMQAVTIGFTGFDGGKLKGLVDICVLVPSWSMDRVEDLHLIVQHLMCTCLRDVPNLDSYDRPQRLAVEPGSEQLTPCENGGLPPPGESALPPGTSPHWICAAIRGIYSRNSRIQRGREFNRLHLSARIRSAASYFGRRVSARAALGSRTKSGGKELSTSEAS